jgi:signal transduction histidine kinase
MVPTERELQMEEGQWTLMGLHPFRTPGDRIGGIVATFVDITELKEVEAQLRQSQSNLAHEVNALRLLHQMTGKVFTLSNMDQALHEILYSAVAVLDADLGNIQLLDSEREILTIVANYGFDQPFLDRFREVGTDDNTACGRALRLKSRALIEDIEIDPEYEPYLAQAREAGYRAVQSTPLINNQGQTLGVLSTHYSQPKDFSNRDQRLLDLVAYQAANLIERLRSEDRLERRVLQRTAQVRQLASDLIAAEQTVRQRLAQTLHDNLQQTLYAAKIQLMLLRDEVGKNEEVDNLMSILTDSLQLTRQLTLELSPPILEEEGLPQALRWLSEHMHEFYGLDVTLKIYDHPDTSTSEQRILLYQIVRELLFNVVKHAEVKEAVVQVEKKGTDLLIRVSDGGLGFDMEVEKAKGSDSFGLFSIHERLRLFDGQAEIQSKPGQGTQILLIIPQEHFEKLNEQKG